MITRAFCEETQKLITIEEYDRKQHKTITCQNKHLLTAKKGNIKRHHFAHQTNTNCNEKTDWHLLWQSIEPDRTEIFFKISPHLEIHKEEIKNLKKEDEINNLKKEDEIKNLKNQDEIKNLKNQENKIPKEKEGTHIADIVTEKGLIIEIQHSPIEESEIREREAFYKEMIWIFDVRYFVTNTLFICRDSKMALIKVCKGYLLFSNKKTYYDCGAFLLKKKGVLKKYILCKIVEYDYFIRKHFPKAKFEYPKDEEFEFAFTVDKLNYISSSSFQKLTFSSTLSIDYSPFLQSKYIKNRYYLPF